MIENEIIEYLQREQGYTTISNLIRYLVVMEDYHIDFVESTVANMIRNKLIIEFEKYIHLNES